jgi:outer membrane protein insertion porin family
MRIVALKNGLLRTTSVCLSLAMAVTPSVAQTPAVPGAATPPPAASAPAAAAPQPAATAPAPAPANVIRRIVVTGTQRIEEATVLTYVNMRQGDLYDPNEVDIALKALFATGLFTAATRIDFAPATGTMTVRVTENPIVNQVVFEGNSKISAKDLTKETQIKPRAVFTRAKVQADVTRIMELYRRNGRFAARVEPQIISRPQNRVDLIFSITEGDSTGVSRVNFIGNKIFNDSTLRSTIATEESAWWKFLSTNDNYDPDRLAYDRELLRRFYVQRGYADFKVTSSVAQLTPGAKSFYVTFTIDEGPRYRFGKVEIDSKIPELAQAQLMPLIKAKQGDWYNSNYLQDGIDVLTNAAGTRGYAFAQVTPRFNRDVEKRIINVSYAIEQGPRVYIEKIDIVGNTRTLDKVIRREFRLVEGDAFNRVMVDRSQQRIRGLGFFKDVQVRNTPGSQPDRTNVTVAVTEQSTGSVAVGLGYSSASSLIGDISYTEINLFGRGQTLNAIARMSYIQRQFQLSFTEPWFMDRPLSAGFDLQKIYTDYTQAAFNSDTSAAVMRFGFPISEFSGVQLTYMYKIQKVSVTGGAPLEILLADGQQNGSVLGYSYTYTDVDDFRKPTTGGMFSFAQYFAGFGGTLRYLESQSNFALYTPIWGGAMVGSLQGKFKYITGYDGTPVPVNSRYFEGGDSFRGFAIAGVGPRDVSQNEQVSAVGGNVSAIGTATLKFPSLFPESFGVNVSLFADFGTVGHLDAVAGRTCTVNSCIRDNLAFRASAGLSVGWVSPFGPLNVDIGIPIAKSPYDREQIIHFSTGTGL